MSKKVLYTIGVLTILTLGIAATSLSTNQGVFSFKREKNRLITSQKYPTQTLEVKIQPTTGDSGQGNESQARYENRDFGFSFNYGDGVVNNRSDESENLNQIEVYYDQRSRVFVTRETIHQPVDPREWFESNRNKYSNLIVENGETRIQGWSTTFLGVPNTCKSVPVVVAILGKDNEIFTFTHFEAASRPFALELGQILQSLAFKGQTNIPQSIPRELLEFPNPPTNISCP